MRVCMVYWCVRVVHACVCIWCAPMVYGVCVWCDEPRWQCMNRCIVWCMCMWVLSMYHSEPAAVLHKSYCRIFLLHLYSLFKVCTDKSDPKIYNTSTRQIKESIIMNLQYSNRKLTRLCLFYFIKFIYSINLFSSFCRDQFRYLHERQVLLGV